MALGTTSVDGLFSGLDTTSLISSLAAIRRKPITLLQQRVTERSTALTSYQSLTAQVLALQTYAAGLAAGDTLRARDVNVSDGSAVVASAQPGAALGEHQLRVESLARAHRLTSGVVADADAPLGFAGDFLLNGKTISLTAEDDLYAVRDAINRADAGVSASILRISATEQRLVLNALRTGAENAVQLADANHTGFLRSLGLLSEAVTTKHALSHGAASDDFRDAQSAVGSLLGLSTPVQGTIQINGVAVAVNLAQDSLQDLAARINSSGAGVTASVTTQTTGGRTTYRLELTGENEAPVLTDDGGVLQALGLQCCAVANELQAAQDSVVHVDGYRVQRATNQLDDVLEGLSLDLLRTTGETAVTLTVTANTERAVSALQQLVNGYNAVVSTIGTGLQFDPETNQGGVFFGDYSLVSIQADLYAAAMNPVLGLTSAYNLPSQLGLSVGKDGKLALDTAALRQMLTTAPEAVQGLLGMTGATSHAEVSFVSATNDTEASGAAGYVIQITQPATRALLRSRDLSGGLTQTETLTINDTCRVTLLAGDSLQTAADKLNMAFNGAGLGLTATIKDGRLQVESRFYGRRYTVRIASSLDAGCGGTDLGGATAGTVNIATGQDVAGTINGQAATGYGQFLTGTEGAVKGLQLQVTSVEAGSKGTVTVSRGLASRLAAYAARATAEGNGVLTLAANTISSNIDELNEEIARLEDSVTDYSDALKEKFAKAEARLAKNNVIMSYLEGQLKSLKASED